MMKRTPMPPPPTLNEMLLGSLQKSLVTAVVTSALYVLARAVTVGIGSVGHGIASMTAEAAISFAVLWPVVFAGFLLASSRHLSNKAFTVAGFVATFLGFSILLIFFVQLGREVWLYFRETPALVLQANEQIRAKLAVLADAELKQKAMQEEISKAEKERDDDLARVTDPKLKAEKLKEYDFAIALLKKDLEQNAEEAKRIGTGFVREDVSTGSLLRYFLTSGPSSEPQDAGILPALLGSLWLGFVTVLFAVPIGVGAALYLEEYRSESWTAKVIQVNINNLAGIPSVVFGILGGFVFVYLFKQLNIKFGLPIDHRALLGGGMTLGLLTLPVIIVSAQEAIRAVPISLRQGAYALGSTKWQVMWHIVLPMSRPGIMTGVILSVSRAIGEAAPLVLFGAKMYVDRSPTLFGRFTAMPLQIFNWCDRPEEIWKYNAALASLVLLTMLVTLNATAIISRNRAQKKLRT